MGQKTSPLNLRLNKNKNWDFQYTVNKQEYAKFLFFILEVKKYFNNLVFLKQKLRIFNIQFKKISKNIYVYLLIQKHSVFNYEYFLDKNILLILNNFLKNEYCIKIFCIYLNSNFLSIQTKSKQFFNHLKKNIWLSKQNKKILYLFLISFSIQNFDLISKFLILNLRNKKVNKRFLYLIKKYLSFFHKFFLNFKGYKIQIKGKIGRSKRSRKLVLTEGKIPLSTLKYNIHFTFNEFKIKSGICSLKIWYFFKK